MLVSGHSQTTAVDINTSNDFEVLSLLLSLYTHSLHLIHCIHTSSVHMYTVLYVVTQNSCLYYTIIYSYRLRIYYL